jgi:hypothetical protein
MHAPLPTAIVALCAALLVACGPSRNAAEDALAQVAAAATKVSPDAQRFAAEDYAAIDAQLNLLKGRLAAGEYGDVVEGVPALRANLDALTSRVEERRKAFEAEVARRKEEWTRAAAEVEGMGQALETRLTMLARQPQLPDNLDRDTFAAIGTDYAKARAEFVRAGGAADAGNYAEALVLAKNARDGFEAVMRDVGLAPALGSADSTNSR